MSVDLLTNLNICKPTEDDTRRELPINPATGRPDITQIEKLETLQSITRPVQTLRPSSCTPNISQITTNISTPKHICGDRKTHRIVVLRTFSGVAKNLRQQTTFFAEYQQLLEDISQNDLSFIYRHVEKILKLTEEALKRYLSANQHEDLLEAFLSLFRAKVENVSYSRSILPTLYSLASRVRALIDSPRNGKKAACPQKSGCFKVYPKDCTSDLLLRHFIQACQTGKARTGEYSIRDQNDAKISLKDYVAKVPEFDLVYWPEIFRIVEQAVRREYDEGKQEPLKQEFLRNMHMEVTPNLQCLGCSKFFYQNQNIFLPTSKPKLVLMGSLRFFKITTNTLKEEVCALLNNKGGIILYGCDREYFNVIARGDSIPEKDKQGIVEEIRKCVSEITPISIDEIDISFIPVKQDPYKTKGVPKLDQSGKNFIERGFIEGQYVVRVKVTPRGGSTAYFWDRNGKPTFTVRNETLNNHPNSKQHISGRHLTAFIKRKCTRFAEQLLDKPRAAAAEVWNFKDIMHQCDLPEKGRPMLVVGPAKLEGDPKSIYKHVSALVVKHLYHKIVLDRLHNLGIEGSISIQFQNYRLKGAGGVALFYHDMRVEEIQGMVGGNRDFEFEGRAMMLLPITPYLKLSDRNARNVMSRADFDSLAVWLRKEFKESQLKMWKFITDENDTEFYVDSGSKEGNLFMYLVMTNFSERSQFRGPKGIERMSEREKNSRFKLLYAAD